MPLRQYQRASITKIFSIGNAKLNIDYKPTSNI